MSNNQFYILIIGFTAALITQNTYAESHIIDDSALKSKNAIAQNNASDIQQTKKNTWTTIKNTTQQAWQKTKEVANDVWEDVQTPTKKTTEHRSTTQSLDIKNKSSSVVKTTSQSINHKSNAFIKNLDNENNLHHKNSNTSCDLRHIYPNTQTNTIPVLSEVKNSDNTHTETIKHGKSVQGRKHHKKSLFRQTEQIVDSWANKYTRFKNKLNKETGISYTLDISYMAQRGAPSGHITPWQSQYYGTITWDMFQSDAIGSGSLNIAYELVRYWNGTGTELGNNIGIITPLNDYTNKANYFYELSYTHQFPDKLDWLSVTLGQIPLYNFDGTTYDSNQQINFINESFSQNATSTYPSASLGGYITVAPDNFWSISVGGQDATSISGNRINTSHFGKKWTTFISGTINPKNKLGQAVLSVLFYNQPSVDAQPEKTKGWSINAQQNIGNKLAVFMRANGVSKGLYGIKQSYVLGGVYNNPLNRNKLDQIGFSGGINKMDKNVNGPNTRSVENILEAYWAWGLSSFMTITPDIQFYINPALNHKSNTATVATIRATMMF